MAPYAPHQLAELGEITVGMIDAVRKFHRDQDVDRDLFCGRLQRLIGDYGTAGVAYAIRSWLDMVIDAAPNAVPGRIDGVAFVDKDSGQFTDITNMSPEYQWAAHALAARLGDEPVRLYEMIDAIPPARADRFLIGAANLVAGILNDLEDDHGPGLDTGDVVSVYVAD